jgi:DNA-directed RNA polymerase specialized sigma24 family protein
MEEFEIDIDEEELARCLAAMAAGDRAFIVTFAERFGADVRALAAHRGADLAGAGDRLVADVAVEVFDRAADWDSAAWELVETTLDDVVSGPEGVSGGSRAICGPETGSDDDAGAGDPADIAVVMTHLAGGDIAFVATLTEHHGARIAATVRRLLRGIGQAHIADDHHEVADIVDEIAFDIIFEKASSWRAEGGALPWVWAEKAIRQLLVSRVGHTRVAVNDDTLGEIPEPEPPVSHQRGTADTWDLARVDDERIVLVDRALELVASERDREVWRQYVIQQSNYDYSPSNTVAAMTGLSSTNVRKISQRVRQGLEHLARDDERFTALRSLAILKT